MATCAGRTPVDEVERQHKGVARRRRLQQKRSIAGRITWLLDLTQAKQSHHTGAPLGTMWEALQLVQAEVQHHKQVLAKLTETLAKGLEVTQTSNDDKKQTEDLEHEQDKETGEDLEVGKPTREEEAKPEGEADEEGADNSPGSALPTKRKKEKKKDEEDKLTNALDKKQGEIEANSCIAVNTSNGEGDGNESRRPTTSTTPQGKHGNERKQAPEHQDEHVKMAATSGGNLEPATGLETPQTETNAAKEVTNASHEKSELPEARTPETGRAGPTPEDFIERYQEAIAKAKTVEDITRLQQALKRGDLPEEDEEADMTARGEGAATSDNGWMEHHEAANEEMWQQTSSASWTGWQARGWQWERQAQAPRKKCRHCGKLSKQAARFCGCGKPLKE